MMFTNKVEDFSKKLNSEDKKEFNEIIDMHTRISSMLEYDIFRIALRHGILFMHEIFQDDIPDCATFPLR